MEMEDEMKNEVEDEMKVEKEDEVKDGKVEKEEEVKDGKLDLNPRSSGRKPALLTTRPRSSTRSCESIE